jgi:hypothetical protein
MVTPPWITRTRWLLLRIVIVWPPVLAPGLPCGVKASLMSRLRDGVRSYKQESHGRARGFIIGQTAADCAGFLVQRAPQPHCRREAAAAYFVFQ